MWRSTAAGAGYTLFRKIIDVAYHRPCVAIVADGRPFPVGIFAGTVFDRPAFLAPPAVARYTAMAGRRPMSGKPVKIAPVDKVAYR